MRCCCRRWPRCYGHRQGNAACCETTCSVVRPDGCPPCPPGWAGLRDNKCAGSVWQRRSIASDGGVTAIQRATAGMVVPVCSPVLACQTCNRQGFRPGGLSGGRGELRKAPDSGARAGGRQAAVGGRCSTLRWSHFSGPVTLAVPLQRSGIAHGLRTALQRLFAK